MSSSISIKQRMWRIFGQQSTPQPGIPLLLIPPKATLTHNRENIPRTKQGLRIITTHKKDPKTLKGILSKQTKNPLRKITNNGKPADNQRIVAGIQCRANPRKKVSFGMDSEYHIPDRHHDNFYTRDEKYDFTDPDSPTSTKYKAEEERKGIMKFQAELSKDVKVAFDKDDDGDCVQPVNSEMSYDWAGILRIEAEKILATLYEKCYFVDNSKKTYFGTYQKNLVDTFSSYFWEYFGIKPGMYGMQSMLDAYHIMFLKKESSVLKAEAINRQTYSLPQTAKMQAGGPMWTPLQLLKTIEGSFQRNIRVIPANYMVLVKENEIFSTYGSAYASDEYRLGPTAYAALWIKPDETWYSNILDTGYFITLTLAAYIETRQHITKDLNIKIGQKDVFDFIQTEISKIVENDLRFRLKCPISVTDIIIRFVASEIPKGYKSSEKNNARLASDIMEKISKYATNAQSKKSQVLANANTEKPIKNRREKSVPRVVSAGANSTSMISRQLKTYMFENGINSKKLTCPAFVVGKCSYGDKCKYSHDESTSYKVPNSVSYEKAISDISSFVSHKTKKKTIKVIKKKK
jgi:hypothetical protein